MPNTFQNASVPHIFLNIKPNWLKNSLSADAIENINQDFQRQYTYENLAAFTNWARKAFITDDITERQEILVSYKNQTDIFANFMGKFISEDLFDYVEFFNQKISASYPLMVYAFNFRDKIIFKVIQAFENPIYVKKLSQIIKEI